MALLGLFVCFAALVSDLSHKLMFIVCGSGAVLVALAFILSVKYDEPPR